MACIPPTSFVPLFGTPTEASIQWMDAHSRMVELWLECQRALWQPALDLQTQWVLQWMEQMGATSAGALAVRGREQLA